MKERVLDVLNQLGFQVEEVGDFAYRFTYEGRNYFYLPNDGNDKEFLCLCLPGVYDIDSNNQEPYNKLMNVINSKFKYIKAYPLADAVALFYEKEILDPDEDLKTSIVRMIMHLDGALYFAHFGYEGIPNEDN